MSANIIEKLKETNMAVKKKAPQKVDEIKKFVLKTLAHLTNAQKRQVARLVAREADGMGNCPELAATLHLAQYGSEEDLYAAVAYMIEKNALKPQTLKFMANGA